TITTCAASSTALQRTMRSPASSRGAARRLSLSTTATPPNASTAPRSFVELAIAGNQRVRHQQHEERVSIQDQRRAAGLRELRAPVEGRDLDAEDDGETEDGGGFSCPEAHRQPPRSHPEVDHHQPDAEAEAGKPE